jgi:predicted  nucleic acid-binding Zn-ribbon protein
MVNVRGLYLAEVLPGMRSSWVNELNPNISFDEVKRGSHRRYWWRCSIGHEYQTTPENLNSKHGCPVCSNRILVTGVNDMATTHPELAADWNFEKNHALTPDVVFAGAAKRFWWKCQKCGNEWQASGNRRTQGTGCGVCANRVFASGQNDLATLFPDVANSWDTERNLPISPDAVPAGSNSKFWWKCHTCGHSWKTTVVGRTSSKSGCPACANKLNQKPRVALIAGETDLQTTHPLIAAEWDFEKNDGLAPTMVTAGSARKVGWICGLSHRWDALVNSRTLQGTGCPFCSGQRVLRGFNDLQTSKPEIAKQWDFAKNEEFNPASISIGSRLSVWWRCDLDHSWKARIANRTYLDRGCPFCGGKKLLEGFNDLLTRYPEIAAEWDSQSNQRQPSEVMPGNNSKAWWICPFGHRYYSSIVGRTGVHGSNCPTCSIGGFDQNKPSKLYFIQNEVLRSRKIGITNSGTNRIEMFEAKGWVLLYQIEQPDGRQIQELEVSLLRWIRHDLGYQVFLGKDEMVSTGGWTETFSIDGIDNSEIFDMIQSEWQRISEGV